MKSGEMSYITTQNKGHILYIKINRPEKMNAFTSEMLRDLAKAYTELEGNRDLRCGLVCAEGAHFTSGLDLAKVADNIQAGKQLTPEELVDPFQISGKLRTKPIVIAVKGNSLTVAIELILAADICVAHRDTKFGQIEVKRGIFPFGGATFRFPQRVGWGNAMRYLLTGDYFSAEEAYRIGLVQEITDGDPFDKAIIIAESIARQAPLAVAATLIHARKSMEINFESIKKELLPTVLELMQTEDAKEGVNSFLERREAKFKGR